jgi:hypothetical protein
MGSFFPDEIKNNLFQHHESTSDLIGNCSRTSQGKHRKINVMLPSFQRLLKSFRDDGFQGKLEQ